MNRISGATRESEHVMTEANGCWPSFARLAMRLSEDVGAAAPARKFLWPVRKRSRDSSVVMNVSFVLNFVNRHESLTDKG